MSTVSLDEFLALRISQRCQYFLEDNRLLALVYAQQLDRPLLENLFRVAEAVRLRGIYP